MLDQRRGQPVAIDLLTLRELERPRDDESRRRQTAEQRLGVDDEPDRLPGREQVERREAIREQIPGRRDRLVRQRLVVGKKRDLGPGREKVELTPELLRRGRRPRNDRDSAARRRSRLRDRQRRRRAVKPPPDDTRPLRRR